MANNTMTARLQALAGVCGVQDIKSFKDGTEPVECTILDGARLTFELITQFLTHDDIVSLIKTQGDVVLRRTAASEVMNERRKAQQEELKRSRAFQADMERVAHEKGYTNVEDMLADLAAN